MNLRHLAVIIILLPSLHGMNVNLYRPYRPNPSPPRSQEITFIAPSADDFLFRPGSPTQLVCRPYLRGLDLTWALSHNKVNEPITTGGASVRFDNSFAIDLPLLELPPGFYDVRVSIQVTATTAIKATTTVGWRVDELAIHNQRPADFDAFWASAIEHLDTIPPVVTCTLEQTLHGSEIDTYNLASASLPENYDPAGVRFDTVEIYRVRFASHGGKTIEGWFTKPVGPGPFPALLVLPGAGNNARPAPVEHARHGYAALDIQVHGNPVDASHYAEVPDEHPTRPEDFIHYGIYLHALQAARVLKQLPAVDSSRLALVGGSQGGRLTLVVAALDPSFKAAIPSITHYAYLPWLHWTERLNANNQSGGDGGFTADTKEAVDVVAPDRYLDVLHFAPLVRCPVLINSGLIDPVSPPTGIQAAYLRITAPKEMIPLPNTAHDWSPAFDRYAWHWLEARLSAPR